MMSGYTMMNGMPMMGPLWWIFMLILWGFAIFGVIMLVRLLIFRADRNQEPPRAETALEILEKRYAKGEISREDYEQIKKDIS
jgi:putative membrane protein